MSSYDTSSEDDAFSPASSTPLSPDSTCKVEIVEQPIKKVRFRYLSELQGTPHGPILGERNKKNLKTFPKVRLIGYEGNETVKMRCWLVDKAEIPKGLIRPHCHDLVVRKCTSKNEIVTEPHEVVISRKNNYTATFENMVVLHNVQRGSECKYLHKEMKWNSRDSMMSVSKWKLNKKKVQDTIKSINKNEVYLYFEAFIEYRNSIQILCYALSHAIKNLKNPYSGDLKICKALNNFGPCEGNTEVGLFTEKVPPDVKVKFFNYETGWEVCVLPEFIHRNMALTLRTPPYPLCNKDDVKVNFCLLREADGVESNTMEFTYQAPEYNFSELNRNKRKRVTEPLVIYGRQENHKFDAISMESEESASDESSVQDDILNMLGNGSLEIYEEIPGSMCQEIEGTNIDESTMIQFIDSNETALNNWSGSSLEEALGLQPVTLDELSLEADGPLSQKSGNKKEGGNAENPKDSRILKSKTREELIVRDILLTSIYKNHVNYLQKAVLLNQVDDLKKLLSSIDEYFKAKKDDFKSKHLFNSLPKFITKIRNEKHQTLLHQAVALKRFNIIPYLLDFGFDPLDKDKQGNNSFHISIKSKSLPTLRALVELCLESQSLLSLIKTKQLKYPHSVLMLANFDGQNILHLAVRSTDVELVNYIVQLKKVNIDSVENNSGDTPLHIACRLQLPAIAEILLNNGADTRLLNLQGFTPLHISVSSNDYNLASLLIKGKSDPTQECISLTREWINDDGSFDDNTIQDDNLQDAEFYPTSNAFSLALDCMMVEILKGDTSKLIENGLQYESKDEPSIGKCSDCLLTSEQVDKLSDLLKEKKMWRDVAHKLNKTHVETLCKNFDHPEKILLYYIEQHKKEIFGEVNQLEQLSNIFSSLNLTEAKEILEK